MWSSKEGTQLVEKLVGLLIKKTQPQQSKQLMQSVMALLELYLIKSKLKSPQFI